MIDWRTAGSGAAGTLVGVGLIAALSAASMGIGDSGPVPEAPLFYLDIAPRPVLPDERPLGPDWVERTTEPRRAPAHAPIPPATDTSSASLPSRVTEPALTSPKGDVSTAEMTRRNAVARSLRRALSNCAILSDPLERAACRDRFARRIEGAPRIAGTGDAGRDTVFARQGARRLAAWEAQRASPALGDPPCETPHPVAGCEGVNIEVDLFSSRDGFLPNLRKRRE